MDQGVRNTGLGRAYSTVTQGAPALALKPFDLYAFPKTTLAAYIHLKTGIGNLGAYIALIGKFTNNRCFRECQAVQTARHLVLQCPLYST